MTESIRVLLVGAGVVGRAIATDHLLAGCEVWMADRDQAVLSGACDAVLRRTDGIADSASLWGAAVPIPVVHMMPRGHDETIGASDALPTWMVIESIAEKLPIKQAFFSEVENWFSRSPILTTNTSTLPITEIAGSMQTHAARFCGMHFFMPVVGRHAAEIIVHPQTSEAVIGACEEHVRRLKKVPLRVLDSPGFVVNRMLAPYLNLSMQLLCAGISASTIREAALRYGMPMSPFELIDLIGPRTAFDGGRVVWQSFPQRMDPSPLLPAMIKRSLLGVAGRKGFYDYSGDGERNVDELSEDVNALVDRYSRDDMGAAGIQGDVQLIADMFAASMWREAQAIDASHVADMETIDQAMAGGLGYVAPAGEMTWREHIESIGEDRFEQLAERFPNLKSLR
ncbi:3-hydroxyacyl-CoA dehydrogenase family protein [Rhodopirellula europaea]|uniref:Multifunctional fatty acid oxidation complex subunit alpha n=1 Tax=Rhodopirellula europaea SH398 TaxID=1263868 RepID=M5S4M1_9BACT|nr:3-hydroxyacyl-CoA dehydrogenase family protein [Rhodopirellula europaea]EMI26460.1 multifunctional fatty acid oxidation complex subunit alpha [Rhodopirellula europaea SH398]